jgi:hypothetical protein
MMSASDIVESISRSGMTIEQFQFAAEQLHTHKSYLEQGIASLFTQHLPNKSIIYAIPAIHNTRISNRMVIEYLFEFALRSAGYKWASFYDDQEHVEEMILYPFSSSGWEAENHIVVRTEARLLQLVAHAHRIGLIAQLVQLFEVCIRAIQRTQ